MAASQVLSRLKQLDAYPKINEDFYSRTLSGGLITIVTSIFMVLLFFTEFRKCAPLPAPDTSLHYPSFSFYSCFS